MAEPPRLDDLDHQLIRLLREDGRAGNRELGQALGVSEGTVRSRIRRLTEAGIMRVVALIDVEAAGNEFFVMSCFQVEGRPVKDVARDLAALPCAVGVSIVSGRYDIVGSFTARDKRDFVRLLAEEFGAIAGLVKVESSVALEILQSSSDWVAMPR
jgi:Lrp/AsnC family transcriptional regulator for asnA, asnC and gidA